MGSSKRSSFLVQPLVLQMNPDHPVCRCRASRERDATKTSSRRELSAERPQTKALLTLLRPPIENRFYCTSIGQ